MKSPWLRVLKGLWPYKFVVVASILCAFGVGLSYAGGVAVLLPVMKIFISTEGIHGWANRSAAQDRLGGVSILDLDSSVRREERPVRGSTTPATSPTTVPAATRAAATLEGLIITRGSAKVAPELGELEIGTRITDVQLLNDVTTPRNVAQAQVWQSMVYVLACAPQGAQVQLTLESPGALPRTVAVTLAQASWINRPLAWTVDFLPDDPTQALIWMVAFFVVLCVVGSIFRYYQQFLGMVVASWVVVDVRRKAYNRILELPTGYFAQKGTSDLTSRMVQDTSTLTDGVMLVLGKAVQEPIKALAAAILAFTINWQLCLLVIVTVPIMGGIIAIFSRWMRRSSRRALENWSRMLGVINETLIGIRVVKAYNAEGYERRRFAKVNADLLKEIRKLSHYWALSRPTIETLSVVLVSIPAIIAAHLVLHGWADKEEFFTLLACFGAMLEPMRRLSDVNSKVQQTNAAATRVFEIIDTPPEPNREHNLPRLSRHKGTIEFRDVSFRYPGHDELVLKNINLTVKHGQTVALVGGNGSGKSTMLNLLPRLYSVTSGQIFIDGQDISTVGVRSLRRQIGIVTQDTLLFADTIYHNIMYSKKHASHDEFLRAAKLAYVEDYIHDLPEGYDTRVGEHGIRLSGGQKQRIAIARAILRDPAILIFDEAMSQIDADSEQKISAALEGLLHTRTTFIIAHRLSTIVTADVIVCLDNGRVAGVGTHSQLVERCPEYRRLFDSQMGDAVAANDNTDRD